MTGTGFNNHQKKSLCRYNILPFVVPVVLKLPVVAVSSVIAVIVTAVVPLGASVISVTLVTGSVHTVMSVTLPVTMVVATVVEFARFGGVAVT